MKLVREHINEKFTEDSDPIHDMGIGLYHNFENEYELEKWIAKNLPLILKTKDIPQDIIKSDDCWIKEKYFTKISMFMDKYLTVNGKGGEIAAHTIHELLKDKGYTVD